MARRATVRHGAEMSPPASVRRPRAVRGEEDDEADLPEGSEAEGPGARADLQNRDGLRAWTRLRVICARCGSRRS